MRSARFNPAWRSSRSVRAFTLTELLAVVFTLGVLLALLVPAYGKARERARRATCLNNVRQLTQAAVAYMADQDGYLPEAGTANVAADAPLSPRSHNKPPWAPRVVGKPDQYVLPSIGGQLRKYLGGATDVWRCPSSPEPTAVPAPVLILQQDQREMFLLQGDDPFSGRSTSDVFNPTYHYMADKEWFGLAKTNAGPAVKYKLRFYAARNVSGLRLSKATARQGASQIVMFHDRYSTYHSEPKPGLDIYDATATAAARYHANFGFLDGHAEGRSYPNLDGYLAQYHNAIRQAWWGSDFAAALPEQYAP